MKTNDTKRTPAISVEVRTANDLINGGLSITFADGERIALQLRDVGHLIEQAALHGFKQKLVDAAAISRDPDTGRSATLADKKAAVLEVFNRITTGGPWNKVREGGGGGNGGLLFAALCRMYVDKAPADIREYLDGLTDKQQSALRGNPKVAAVIDEIRTERAGADSIDSDGLLAGLEG